GYLDRGCAHHGHPGHLRPVPAGRRRIRPGRPPTGPSGAGTACRWHAADRGVLAGKPGPEQRGVKPVLRLCALLLGVSLLSTSIASESADQTPRHSLWSLQGKANTVYLLGSVHLLSPDEPLPAVMDEAYQQSTELLMELDM